jgi:hypothetical protein
MALELQDILIAFTRQEDASTAFRLGHKSGVSVSGASNNLHLTQSLA